METIRNKIGTIICLTIIFMASVAFAGVITPNGGKNNHVLLPQTNIILKKNSSQFGAGITFSEAPKMQEECTITIVPTIEGEYKYSLIIADYYQKAADGKSILAELDYGIQDSNTFNVTIMDPSLYYIQFSVYDMDNIALYTGYIMKRVENNPTKLTSKAYASKVVAECKKDTDYETAVALHDWLINHARYDFTYVNHGAGYVLMDTVGVCDSFSKAYNLLLEAAGITSKRVENTTHAWNVVQLDGKWYQVDLTWDDGSTKSTDGVICGNENHFYCFVPDKYISRSHQSGYTLPGDCDSYDKIYYVLHPSTKDYRGGLYDWLEQNEVYELIESKLTGNHEKFECSPLTNTFAYLNSSNKTVSTTNSIYTDLIYDMCVRYLNTNQGILYNGQEVLTTLDYDFDTNTISGTAGHREKKMDEEQATCNELGYTAGVVCEICNEILTGREEIQALGHLYSEPEYEWSQDNKTVTASRSCTRKGCEEKEEETVITTETIISEPTCTDYGVTLFTAAFKSESFVEQTRDDTNLTPLGHLYRVEGYSANAETGFFEATIVCSACGDVQTNTAQVSSEIVKEATCTEDGSLKHTVITLWDEQEYVYEETEEVKAYGHNWGETEYIWSDDFESIIAVRKCQRNEEHQELVTAKVKSEVTKDSECIEPGETTYTAEFEEEWATEQARTEVNIPAKGHMYNLVEYIWSDDGYFCSVKLECSQCKDNQTYDMNVTKVNEIAAECEKDGMITLASELEFEGKKYTDTKETVIPGMGHDWEETTYEWSEDRSSVTAIRVCGRNKDHTEVVTVKTESEVIKEAYCDENGITRYTAIFSNEWAETQVLTEDNIQARGHTFTPTEIKWGNDLESSRLSLKCTECGNEESVDIPVEKKIIKNATCSEKGVTKYTAAIQYDGVVYEDTKEIENIEVLGHDWIDSEYIWKDDNTEVGAYLICGRNKTHKELIETAKTDYKITMAATCDEPGEAVYQAKFEDNRFKEQEVRVELPTLEHKWKVNYSWSESGDECKVSIECELCKAEYEIDADITSEVLVKETCTESGITRYTAETEWNGRALTDTKDIEDRPSTGHRWNIPEYVWNNDCSVVMAIRNCMNNDEHTEIENGIVTSEITKKPECNICGEIVYTATFQNEVFETQKKTDKIPQIEHKWLLEYDWDKKTGKLVCENDVSHEIPEEELDIQIEENVIQEATCTETGIVEYKVIASYSKETYELTRISEIEPKGHTPSEQVIENKTESTIEKEDGYDLVVYCSVCGEEITRKHVIQPSKEDKVEETEEADIPKSIPEVAETTESGIPSTALIGGEDNQESEYRFDSVGGKDIDVDNSTEEMIMYDKQTVIDNAKIIPRKDGTAVYAGPEKEKSEIIIPDSVEINGRTFKITKISNKAFYKNKKIKKVNIGANIIEIGNYAFAYCSKLKTVTGGTKVKIISKYAFANDSKLNSIPAMSKLEIIEDNAFKYCTSLTKITIGTKVNKIGQKAFYGAKKLKTITIKSKLLNIENVGANAFKNIFSTTKIKCPETKLIEYKVWLRKKGVTKNAKIK